MRIVLIAASILTIIWIVLLFLASNEDCVLAAQGTLRNNQIRIQSLEKKAQRNKKRLAEEYGMAKVFISLFRKTEYGKEIQRLKKKNEQIHKGVFKSVSIWDLPGYVVLRCFTNLGASPIYKKIYSAHYELYGSNRPDVPTKRLLARGISFLLIGVAMTLICGAIVMVLFDTLPGIGIMTVGTAIVIVLVYAMYDELMDQANKRHKEIVRQFPNVVSKLAILVTSGMIMKKAWDETALSNDGELYQQMRITSRRLNNLESPEIAYGAFINRCNTKETTRLASAIMQNQEKNNTQIAVLLRNMAAEAWDERRNMAKRDSENATSRLMIPTMLLFVAILIMLMVPVVISFTSI